MSHTMQTTLSILLMIVGVGYIIAYLQKKKKNTHNDIVYKLVFIIVFFLIVIPLFLTFK